MIVNLGADRHMMKRLMFLGAATTVIAMTVPATQAQDAAALDAPAEEPSLQDPPPANSGKLLFLILSFFLGC